jgi:indole-3-glycerol phosphate synthase
MATYLDAILAFHRSRAAADDRDLDDLVARAGAVAPARDFTGALERPGMAVVAEVKRRSPSKGALAPDLVPGRLALSYSHGGAACLSVLTDAPHFGGCPADLGEARDAVDLPVLRKDFTVDPRDVCDARLMGADAVLLIAAALSDAELAHCGAVADQLGMAALCEVHDGRELDRVLAAGARVVGVNQRDLVTFEVDRDRAVRLGAAVPAGVVKVAESGITGPDDVGPLVAAGYDAVLVGEALVRAADPAKAVADLVAAGARCS